MNKNNKSFIITVAIIGVIIIGLLIYYFGMGNKKSFFGGFGGGSSSNQIYSKDKVFSKEMGNYTTLTAVNDYGVFFNVNDLINNYYKTMVDNDTSANYKLLDSSYIVLNNINELNVRSYMKSGYSDITYVSKTMYFKSRDNILYFFVSGELQLYNFSTKLLSEENGVKFLVTVDSNNKAYSIYPLTIDEIYSYAQNYKMLESKFVANNNSYNEYETKTYSDEDIASIYFNYFKSLLYINSEKSYGLLSDTTKNSKYPTFEEFGKGLNSLYESLNSNILSYSANGASGKKTVSVVDGNNKKIDFVESSIMNFSVTLY